MLENPQITVGAAIAEFLEHCGVKAAFGVISIHNMPILDAMFARGRVRFVMARGEAGAGNMADAFARSTSGLGVCITSTGPAAGNIAGSLVEAYTAGVPLLHITARALPSARCALVTVSGAPLTRFVVYTAAALHMVSLTIIARSFFVLPALMPQFMPPARNPFALQTPPSIYFIYNNPFPSSSPSMIFIFWMAAPDAPLPRLSYVATSRI